MKTLSYEYAFSCNFSLHLKPPQRIPLMFSKGFNTTQTQKIEAAVFLCDGVCL